MALRRILIIGGYGGFGGRLAKLLRDDARLALLVAGRDLKKARAFCDAQAGAPASFIPVAFTRGRDHRAALGSLHADLVVDASGPFQDYGDDPQALARDAVASGIPCIDLTDSADYVEAISALDDAARAQGVFVLSGLSTCPALTSAVVRDLAKGMARVTSITGGIAPSPFLDMGESVLRAIASYAGKAVPVWGQGKVGMDRALLSHRHLHIAPPGAVPLGRRFFSLVEVPDLRLMPKVATGLRDVWFGASIRPRLQHWAVIALAMLVRVRVFGSLRPFVRMMGFWQKRLRWGAHRGGMVVEVRGEDATSQTITRSFHLLAEGDTGPFVPVMAAAAVIKRWCEGIVPAQGARPALSELELADFAPFFTRLKMATGTRERMAATAPLYQRLLGSKWRDLPEEIRAMHDVASSCRVAGRAKVHRGRNPLARLTAFIVRFPPTSDDVAVNVQFDAKDGIETWTRDFGGKRFASRQEEGCGARAHLMIERFGPLAFAMAVVLEPGRMSLVHVGWRIFGIPMPRFLAPRVVAYEEVRDGKFNFHVRVTHPLCGLIVQYDGWLARENECMPS